MKKYHKQWRRLAWMELKRERDEIEESFSTLENADPELCIKLLQFPTVHNFYGIKRKIETSSDEWMQEFLVQNGLVQLFATLERLSEKSDKERNILTYAELSQCVECLKSIINSELGLDFVVAHKDSTKMLSKTLCSKNTTVKTTVFQLLAAMHVYSSEGGKRALGAIEDYKVLQSQRYRFSIVVNDLRSSENPTYKTALLAFINAVLWSTKNLPQRMRLRNEIIGLNLLDVLSVVRRNRCYKLLEQIDIFDERKLQDEEALTQLYGGQEFDINDVKDVFFALFNKICNTPQADNLLTILQCLLQLNPKESVSDVAWEVLEKNTQRVVVIETEDEGRRFLKSDEKDFQRLNAKMPVEVYDLATSDEVDGVVVSADEHSDDDDGFSVSADELSDDDDGDEIDGLVENYDQVDNHRVEADELTSTDNFVKPQVPCNAASLLFPDKFPFNSASSLEGGGAPPPPPPSPPPPPALGIGNTAKLELRRTVQVPKPASKLRKLNWKILQPNTVKKSKNSVWNCLEKKGYEVEANYQTLDKLFAQKKNKNKTDKNETNGTPNPAEVVSLIDPRLSLNIGIFLKQFRMPMGEVIKALKNGNEKVLTAQKYKGMQKYLPEPSDIETVQGFTGDVQLLNDVDTYFLLLSKLPDYELKIDLGASRSTFNDDILELAPRYQQIKKACKDILNSEGLKIFLLLVLKTGNYLNYGSHAGNALGFNVTSLLKLSDTKANKPQTTLLDYIISEEGTRYPQITNLPNEMKTVIDCNGMSLEQVTNKMRKFASHVKKLNKKVNNSSEDIKRQFKEFYKYACDTISSFDKEIKEMEELSKKIAEYFAEDPKQFKWDECISTLVEIFGQVSRSIQQKKEQELQAEKQRKREQTRLKHKTGNNISKTQKSPSQTKMVEELLQMMAHRNR